MVAGRVGARLGVRAGAPTRCSSGTVRSSTAGESPKSAASCSSMAAATGLALRRRREQHVPRLDVRPDVVVAQGIEGRPQLGHGDAAVAGHVHAAQEGDVAGHGSKLPGVTAARRCPSGRPRRCRKGRGRPAGASPRPGRPGSAEQRTELEAVAAGAAADHDARPGRARSRCRPSCRRRSARWPPARDRGPAAAGARRVKREERRVVVDRAPGRPGRSARAPCRGVMRHLEHARCGPPPRTGRPYIMSSPHSMNTGSPPGRLRRRPEVRHLGQRGDAADRRGPIAAEQPQRDGPAQTTTTSARGSVCPPSLPTPRRAARAPSSPACRSCTRSHPSESAARQASAASTPESGSKSTGRAPPAREPRPASPAAAHRHAVRKGAATFDRRLPKSPDRSPAATSVRSPPPRRQRSRAATPSRRSAPLDTPAGRSVRPPWSRTHVADRRPGLRPYRPTPPRQRPRGRQPEQPAPDHHATADPARRRS